MTWIKEIVIGMVEVYGTRDVYKLVDKLDITLIKKYLRGTKGRFFRDMFENEYIFVSNNLSYEEEKIIIAHELGHLILHTNLSTSHYSSNKHLVKNKLEVQADKFAAELLIPDDVDFSGYDNLTTKQLSCHLKVPEEFIKLKYKDVI